MAKLEAIVAQYAEAFGTLEASPASSNVVFELRAASTNARRDVAASSLGSNVEQRGQIATWALNKMFIKAFDLERTELLRVKGGARDRIWLAVKCSIARYIRLTKLLQPADQYQSPNRAQDYQCNCEIRHGFIAGAQTDWCEPARQMVMTYDRFQDWIESKEGIGLEGTNPYRVEVKTTDLWEP